MGSLKDRAETLTVKADRALSYMELDVLYVENHIVSDYADLVVEDVESAVNYRNTKDGIDLNLEECFYARSKARLYGWAFLGFTGDKLVSLSPQECTYDYQYRTGAITRVIDLYEDKEFIADNFKLIKTGQTVNRTTTFQYGDQLGISPVRRFWKDALRYEIISNVISNLLIEKKVSRLGVDDLFERINDTEFMKSITSMVMWRDVLGLDLFDRKTMEHTLEEKNLSGLDSINNIYMDRLAGATDYPKARLFNLSPEGQSSGNWEDSIWNSKVAKEFGKIAPILHWALSKIGAKDVEPYLNKELGIPEITELVKAKIWDVETAKSYLNRYLN